MASAYVSPPSRDGVGASRVQVMAGQANSALAFLCARFPAVSEEIWRSRFARGLVLDAGGVPLRGHEQRRSGDTLFYYRELPAETRIPFEATILYHDEHILVADKPHFLPVIPSGRFVQESLLVRLKQSTGIDTLSPIHRIDRDTAGLVLFSCHPATRDAYQALFRERRVHKTYEALAPWPQTPLPSRYRSRLVEDAQFFRSCEVAGEPNSETLIETLSAIKNLSIIEALSAHDTLAHFRLKPVTGRKHQLRVHMAALGAPIVNDRLYPTALPQQEDDYSKPLQLLARSLQFVDPVSEKEQVFHSQRQLEHFQLPA